MQEAEDRIEWVAPEVEVLDVSETASNLGPGLDAGADLFQQS